MHALIDKLSTDHHLRDDEYLELIENRSEEAAELLAQRAVEARQPI
jgi:hypothetical protein